jgi:hypothetical protein
MVFVKKVLYKTDREEVEQSWRKLDNEGLRDLYSAKYYLDDLMKDERACHVVRTEKPEVHTKFGGKPGGKTIWKTNA